MSVTFEGKDSFNIVARKLLVWTCPIHESYWEDPNYYEHYCDCEYCPHNDEPEVCPTCETGEWWVACDDEGNELYEFVLEPIINRILKELYLPAITETLNNQFFLLERMIGDNNETPTVLPEPT